MANRGRRNNVGTDDIAHAIHPMVEAKQPIAAQPRFVVAPTRCNVPNKKIKLIK